MFPGLHTRYRSGYKMQLWSMTTSSQSDASLAFRLEEERGSRHSDKCFSILLSFCDVIEAQPYQNSDVHSQATKQENIPGAEYEH